MAVFSGGDPTRTGDLLRARQPLSQLSYAPNLNFQFVFMGLSGVEPPTSRLSGVRSNQLSYKPLLMGNKKRAFRP